MTAPRQPSPIVACEQLARQWKNCNAWSGGLTFADPVTEGATPALANLYARVLPSIEFRRQPACSLMVSPAGAPTGQSTTTPIGVTCVAHGETERQAMALLNDLRRLILPNGRGFTHNPPAHSGSFNPAGVIGAPYVAPGDDADVWRFITIDIRADIQPIRFGPGEDATPDGEAAAQLDLVCACVPDVMPPPLVGFSLYHATATSASVVLDQAAGTLSLSFAAGGPIVENEFDLTHADYNTVAKLRAAITALSTWTVGDADAATDARPSVELFDHANTNPTSAANKSLLRMHA